MASAELQPDPMARMRADIEALRQRLAAELQQTFELRETHISWLLLGEQRVWKFKKPVQWPFLDFSTLALRHFFCEEELRLNQRLAPQLYLGLASLWRDAQGQLSLEPPAQGEAEPVEYAVEMRRFPDDALLLQRLEDGLLQDQEVLELAGTMAAFHRRIAGAALPDARYGAPARVLGDVLDLFEPLSRSAFADLQGRWRDWVERQAGSLEGVWATRHAGGFVRECHGDLHLGNLVRFEGRSLPFDCIEFQPGMRWIDVVNDVAFLTMDLQARGRADLAALFMDEYLQHSGDYASLAVWRFYEVYRALVRAMVAQLPGEGKDPLAGRLYAQLLERWIGAEAAAAPAGVPAARLYITCGFSGSGKSTVAQALVRHTGAVRIRSDVERKRLFGLGALDDSHQRGLDIYTPQATEQTFAQLQVHASAALRAGYAVVVDAAFLRRAQRQVFAELARREGVPFIILDCQAPLEVLRQRIAARQQAGRDASEATLEVLEQQQAWREPFDAAELADVRRVDTTQPDVLGQLQQDELALLQQLGKTSH